MAEVDDKTIETIVRKAIDMHVHVGPEIIPRRFDAASLLRNQRGKMAGAVLKNHFSATVPFAESRDDFLEFGAIVLNWPVGGLNPEAIRAASYLADKPFVVWMPTIHARNFLDKSEYEIAPEWCSGRDIPLRKATDVEGISLLSSDGGLTDDAKSVVLAVRDANAVLATGHISVDESLAVAEYAIESGVRAVVITHPVYQRVGMSVEVQKELARKGCYMEVCWSMNAIDGIAMVKLAEQIRSIGPEGVVISSDSGQAASPAPDEALKIFCKLLVKEGIPVKWLERMLVINPRKILGVK